MQKQKQQDEEISLTNAYSLFVYAIRTQITRDYYLRRLRTFFDFIKILPNAKIEQIEIGAHPFLSLISFIKSVIQTGLKIP
ncbi:MAG: hypothetical protein WBN72_11000 [Nitrososphaeraceae archaeon]